MIILYIMGLYKEDLTMKKYLSFVLISLMLFMNAVSLLGLDSSISEYLLWK